MSIFDHKEIEDAVIVEETAKPSVESVPAPDATGTTPSGMPLTLTDDDMKKLMARSKTMNAGVSGNFGGKSFDDMLAAAQNKPAATTTGDEPQVAKKKHLTVKFNVRSCFLPPGVVFIGTGDVKVKYKQWLDMRFKQVMADLGTSRKPNGAYPKKFSAAVQFIRTAIHLLDLEDQYETLTYVFEGQALPRDIGFFDAVKAMLQENKGLIKAIAPYYAPKSPEPEEEEPKVGGEVLASLQNEDKADTQPIAVRTGPEHAVEGAAELQFTERGEAVLTPVETESK